MQKKKGGDFDPELAQAVIDPYLIYGSGKRLPRARPNELQAWVRILRQADMIVRCLKQFLCLKRADVNATTDVLEETAHALLDLGAAPGRSMNIGLGHYAYRLNNIFKLYYGKQKPEWVWQALAESKIQGVLKDRGQGTIEEWVKNLTKRHRKFLNDLHRREIAEFRNARERLRRKLADPHPKTLSSYYPSLLKSQDAKFWPDELPSHDPRKCSMCVKRRQRSRIQRHDEPEPKLKASGPLDKHSRGELSCVLTVKLMNRLESKRKDGAITEDQIESLLRKNDLHRKLYRAATVKEACKIVDSVDNYVEGWQKSFSWPRLTKS